MAHHDTEGLFQYQTDVFEACESDNMDPVGVYTGSDGKVTTYSQPAVVTSLPSVRVRFYMILYVRVSSVADVSMCFLL